MVGVGGVGSVVEGGVSGVWYSNRSVERCEIVVNAIVPGVGNVGDRAMSLHPARATTPRQEWSGG
jgi:hypothetical protein